MQRLSIAAATCSVCRPHCNWDAQGGQAREKAKEGRDGPCESVAVQAPARHSERQEAHQSVGCACVPAWPSLATRASTHKVVSSVRLPIESGKALSRLN
jgi:hypothetical protein